MLRDYRVETIDKIMSLKHGASTYRSLMEFNHRTHLRFGIHGELEGIIGRTPSTTPKRNRVSVQLALQKLIPKRLVSAMAGALARLHRPEWLKNQAIRWYIQHYGVDMSLAKRPLPANYFNFEDFFTRELKPQALAMPSITNAIACPAHGSISNSGRIEDGLLVQAKGYRYPVSQLTGRDSLTYEGGSFLTVYLAPQDYHRVHVPVDAQLEEGISFPGSLFSVNAATESGIPGLFCKNERAAFHFRLASGPLCLVMVGALIVAGIRSPFAPSLVARRGSKDVRKSYCENVKQGMELARFVMGSTVILLVSPRVGQLEKLPTGRAVRTGEVIGELHPL